MPKFNVGDIVTGINIDSYVYTTSDAIMEVVNVFDRDNVDIEVKILKHQRLSEKVGKSYRADSHYFELVTPLNLENE